MCHIKKDDQECEWRRDLGGGSKYLSCINSLSFGVTKPMEPFSLFGCFRVMRSAYARNIMVLYIPGPARPSSVQSQSSNKLPITHFMKQGN